MIIPFRNPSLISHAKLAALCTLILCSVGYFFLDPFLARLCSHLPPLVTSPIDFLSNLILPLFNFILWPILYFFFRYKLKKPKIAQGILLIIIAIPFAILASSSIKWLFGRARPEFLLTQGVYGFTWFSTNQLFQSFPSGHAVTGGVIAGSLSALKPQWTLPCIGIAFALALTRVVLNMHFFSDVVAGLFLGVLIAQWIHNKM